MAKWVKKVRRDAVTWRREVDSRQAQNPGPAHDVPAGVKDNLVVEADPLGEVLGVIPWALREGMILRRLDSLGSNWLHHLKG